MKNILNLIIINLLCLNTFSQNTGESPMLIKMFLDWPVQNDLIDTLEIRVVEEEVEPIGYGINYTYFSDTLNIASIHGRRYGHKDKIWAFGMKNWKLTEFICTSPDLPLLFNVKVGNAESTIPALFGSPKIKNESMIIYDYKSEYKKELQFVIENNVIKKVIISSFE